ncbi:Bacteriophage abortive infection AbiH [Terribacillus saccharophilus]|uniref:Bacteriophage abortive infection AbiH n=1 Tax=Terribacillus saccharophilus TaxID=361277 RepID=A0AAX2EJU6_9BACI|nr:Bacteriophage abortive infection AbiH [Terribacillus saccharophilus]
MNITFLIGNGFDLQAGMKTSFVNFYDYLQENELWEEIGPPLSDNIKRDIESWADFEFSLGELTYNDEVLSDPEQLFNSLDNFKAVFADYLINEEKRINLDFESQAIRENITLTLDNFYSELQFNEKTAFKSRLTPGQSWYYNFITFNYTSLFTRCYQTLSDNFSIHTHGNGTYFNTKREFIDIHGTYHQHMLLGVNDDTQFNSELQEINDESSSVLVKDITNVELRNGKRERAARVIRDSNVICIYGMSLGVTDKLWWQMIGSRLLKDRSTQLIIFAYEGVERGTSSRSSIQRRKKWESKFLNYMDISEDEREDLLSRIYICIDSKQMFRLPETVEAILD